MGEFLGVSRRTVSRWETGSNMPDLDILIEMADYYDVDLRELLDGERKSEKMNKELEETVFYTIMHLSVIIFLQEFIIYGQELVGDLASPSPSFFRLTDDKKQSASELLFAPKAWLTS